MNVETICQYHCETGEGPLWDVERKCLFWGDIPTGRLFRYEPATGEHEQIYDDRPVGGFTLQANGDLLLFRDRGNVVTWRDGQVRDTILEDIADERETRFNDVFADPRGRVFCGTMPTPDRKGRLYRLDPDGSCHLLLEGIGCSNGMGLTLDGRQLYYTDSAAHAIYLFDYDEQTGAITNRRPFATVEGKAVPDGMTVDAQGDVWSAQWAGACVVRYAPDGTLKQRIEMPTLNITSVMFGGDAMDELYVTSAIGGQQDADPTYAGALFRLRPGVSGQAEHRSRIGL